MVEPGNKAGDAAGKTAGDSSGAGDSAFKVRPPHVHSSTQTLVLDTPPASAAQIGEGLVCAKYGIDVAYTVASERKQDDNSKTHWGYDLAGCDVCDGTCGRVRFMQEKVLASYRSDMTKKKSFRDAATNTKKQ